MAKAPAPGAGCAPSSYLSTTVVLKILFYHGLWLAGAFSVIGVILGTKAFSPCNEEACLYSRMFSTEYQPSTLPLVMNLTAPFLLVKNGEHLPPLLEDNFRKAGVNPHGRKPFGTSALCASEDMQRLIQFDLDKQFSLYALIAMLLLEYVLNTAHDVFVVQGEEAISTKLALCSWLAWGMATSCAMLWASGIAETFVAVDSANACFYTVPVPTAMLSCVSTFAMCLKFALRISKVYAGVCFGEHLYAFNDQVPYQLVKANIDAGFIGDPSSSMQRPLLAGDVAKMPGRRPREEESDPSRQQIKKRVVQNLWHSALRIALAIGLPGSRQMPVWTIMWSVSIVAIGLFRMMHSWPMMVKDFANDTEGMPESSSDGPNHAHSEAAERMVARSKAAECIVKAIWYFSYGLLYIFAVSGLFVLGPRSCFYLFGICPWLGPAAPSPDVALALGYDTVNIFCVGISTLFTSARQDFIEDFLPACRAIAAGLHEPTRSEFNEAAKKIGLAIMSGLEFADTPQEVPENFLDAVRK